MKVPSCRAAQGRASSLAATSGIHAAKAGGSAHEMHSDLAMVRFRAIQPAALVATSALLLACPEDKQADDIDERLGYDVKAEQAEPKGEAEEAEPNPSPAPAPYTLDPGAENPEEVKHAVAVLSPTEGNEARGTVHFEKVSQGLEVTADFENLPPGPHAFHVHVFGDCSSPDAKSADTHFHFTGPSMNPPADIDHITGNLGEVTADESGSAQAKATIEDAKLQGPFSILGRSVIIHEKGNDPQQPPIGAAGGRLACGVIGMTDSKAEG